MKSGNLGLESKQCFWSSLKQRLGFVKRTYGSIFIVTDVPLDETNLKNAEGLCNRSRTSSYSSIDLGHMVCISVCVRPAISICSACLE